MPARNNHGMFISKEPNYAWLFEYESIKNWAMSIRSPKTGELYFRTLHNFITKFLPSNSTIKNPDDLVKVNDAEAIDLIRKFSNHYSNQNKLKMAELAKTILKSFYAANNRELRSRHLKVHKVPRSSKTYNRIVPTKEQVYLLADSSMSLRDRALILVMWQSGLRNSTIRNLKVKHVKAALLKNENPLKIEITPEIDEKSLREPYYTFISNDAIESLRNYLFTRGKIEDLHEDDPLFLSNLPNVVKPLTDVGVLRIIKRASVRARLNPKRLSPQSLRASFFNMLGGKVDETIRKFLFGHSIGIRPHYFTPEFVDTVRQSYASVDWNRTKIITVEESKEEIGSLKAELKKLKERNQFLSDALNFVDKKIALDADHQLFKVNGEQEPGPEFLDVWKKIVEQQKLQNETSSLSFYSYLNKTYEIVTANNEEELDKYLALGFDIVIKINGDRYKLRRKISNNSLNKQ